MSIRRWVNYQYITCTALSIISILHVQHCLLLVYYMYSTVYYELCILKHCLISILHVQLILFVILWTLSIVVTIGTNQKKCHIIIEVVLCTKATLLGSLEIVLIIEASLFQMCPDQRGFHCISSIIPSVHTIQNDDFYIIGTTIVVMMK